ncbi:MAG TPA: alpha-amylase family glycosyl hydrolase [Verrucomicrobiae bacterium]|nr:alpha-amylase family glycosyl hydrolase [Verrucomicrobiae bacterium]
MVPTVSRPLLYEVHTRSWLREWSARLKRPVGLGEVPDDDLVQWRAWGFTHVWLMGVWATSQASRRVFLEHPGTSAHLDEVCPGWEPDDVPGSAFAIAGYKVPERCGGEAGLQRLRERLHAHGMRLILDFIPNHVGLDHPWVWEHPERFVPSPGAQPGPGHFLAKTSDGPRWFAHGKDPWFPPWMDTAQLDFRRADTRAAMTAELRSLTARCDGLRCDMTMLLLHDVFARTWEKHPCAQASAGEFWAKAVAAARSPGFTLLAEAYWDLEERLQRLGFDYVYDKRVTDCLIGRDPAGLQRLLRSRSAEFLQRSVHFLENHDEPRVAGHLTLAEHRAAAWLILGLPGLPMLHEGQLSGARVRASVHMNRRAPEAADAEIAAMYEDLLSAIRGSKVGTGTAIVLRPGAEPDGQDLNERVTVVAWSGTSDQASGWDLTVANPSPRGGKCRVVLPGPNPPNRLWWVRNRFAPQPKQRMDLQGGLLLELPAYGVQLLELRPA